MLNHKGTQTIETPRLILRQACMADAEPMFHNWAGDPEVTKFLTWPAYQTVDTAHVRLAVWIENYEKPDYYQWMIVPKALGQPIGSISAVKHNDSVAKAEIGYCIGKAWWHQGIMTEALGAVMEYLFDEVGMNRVEARHDPKNPHSGAVMRKCGMTYEGTLRQADRNNQGICDMAVYAMLAQDRKKKGEWIHAADGI